MHFSNCSRINRPRGKLSSFWSAWKIDFHGKENAFPAWFQKIISGKCQIITRLIVFLITPISRFFGYFVWQLHNCTLRDQFLAQPLPVNHSIGFCFRVADFSVSKLSAAHLRSLRVYFGADVKISVAIFLLLHYLCTRKFIELNIFCLNFKVIHEPSQYQNSITHFLPGR